MIVETGPRRGRWTAAETEERGRREKRGRAPEAPERLSYPGSPPLQPRPFTVPRPPPPCGRRARNRMQAGPGPGWGGARAAAFPTERRGNAPGVRAGARRVRGESGPVPGAGAGCTVPGGWVGGWVPRGRRRCGVIHPQWIRCRRRLANHGAGVGDGFTDVFRVSGAALPGVAGDSCCGYRDCAGPCLSRFLRLLGFFGGGWNLNCWWQRGLIGSEFGLWSAPILFGTQLNFGRFLKHGKFLFVLGGVVLVSSRKRFGLSFPIHNGIIVQVIMSFYKMLCFWFYYIHIFPLQVIVMCKSKPLGNQRLLPRLLELYGKSLPELQFVYSKRKESTKLFYAPKQNEKKFGPEYEATNE